MNNLFLCTYLKNIFLKVNLLINKKRFVLIFFKFPDLTQIIYLHFTINLNSWFSRLVYDFNLFSFLIYQLTSSHKKWLRLICFKTRFKVALYLLTSRQLLPFRLFPLGRRDSQKWKLKRIFLDLIISDSYKRQLSSNCAFKELGNYTLRLLTYTNIKKNIHTHKSKHDFSRFCKILWIKRA